MLNNVEPDVLSEKTMSLNLALMRSMNMTLEMVQKETLGKW